MRRNGACRRWAREWGLPQVSAGRKPQDPVPLEEAHRTDTLGLHSTCTLKNRPAQGAESGFESARAGEGLGTMLSGQGVSVGVTEHLGIE